MDGDDHTGAQQPGELGVARVPRHTPGATICRGSSTCTWTVRGFFDGEGMGPNQDQVRIVPRARFGGKTYRPTGTDRHDVTIRNRPPTMVSRMEVDPWPSYWIGADHPDRMEYCPDDDNGCFMPVTIITEVCDEDDPISFDPVTYRCGGSRRKPSSYLHDPSNYSWQSARLGPTIEVFSHAPWRANFTPPPDAQNGQTYTIGIAVTDPKGTNLNNAVASVFPQVVVQGKPEPKPPSSFNVEIVDTRTGERLDPFTFTYIVLGHPTRGGLELTMKVTGTYTEPLRFEWQNTHVRGDGQTDSSSRVGSFRPPDQAATRWTALQWTRDHATESIGIGGTVTDATGFSRDASEVPVKTCISTPCP